jgi:hypothetical protein
MLVEAYNSMGIIERYYALIQRIHHIIMAEIHNINENMAL